MFQNSSVYALADHDVTAPLTKPRSSRWERTKQWVRERPVTSTLIGLLVAGCIVAVIVGPVVGLRNKDGDSSQAGDLSSAQPTEVKLTFQASNAPDACANFSDPSFLSQYGAALQSNVASLLGVDPSQVAVQSVQCGSQTFQLPSSGSSGSGKSSTGNRRMLLADAQYLVVLFRITPPSTPTASPSTVSNPVAIAALLQSDQSKETLSQTVSKLLGIPHSSVILVSVVTTPVASPSPSPSPLPPPPFQPQPSTSPLSPPGPAPVPAYGSSPSPAALSSPPPYGGSSGQSAPPPVYGPSPSGGSAPQPSAYGSH